MRKTITCAGLIIAAAAWAVGCGGGGGDGTESDPPQTYSLSVTVLGAGSGAVISSPAGLDCDTTCNSNFDSGSSVTLTAEPGDGAVFIGWTGACTGAGTCTLSMTGNRSATAVFSDSALVGDLKVFRMSYEDIEVGAARDTEGFSIFGRGFVPGATVRAGDTQLAATVIDAGEIVVSANQFPQSSAGVVPLFVTNPGASEVFGRNIRIVDPAEGAMDMGGGLIAIDDTRILAVVAPQFSEAPVKLVGLDSQFETAEIAMPAGYYPHAVAVHRDLGMAYVSLLDVDNGIGRVAVIDLDDRELVTTIAVGANPFAVAVNEQTDQVYVANNLSGSVSAIDALTNAVVWDIAGFSGPQAVALNPLSQELVVLDNDGITVIDPAGPAILGQLALERGSDLAVHAADNQAYVALDDEGAVAIVDLASRTVVDRLRVQSTGRGLLVDEADDRLFVAGSRDLVDSRIIGSDGESTSNRVMGLVDVVDIGTKTVVETIYTPQPAVGLARHGDSLFLGGRFITDAGEIGPTIDLLRPTARPVLASVMPNPVVAGSGAVALQVFGRGFEPGMQFHVGGLGIPADVQSDSRATVTVPADAIAEPTLLNTWVSTDAASNVLDIPVSAPPIITGVRRAALCVGSGDYAILTDADDDMAHVVDMDAEILIGSIAVGDRPVACDIESSVGVVLNMDSSDLSVVDAVGMAVTATIPMPAGTEIVDGPTVAIHDGRNQAFVAAIDGAGFAQVVVVDLATNTVDEVVDLGTILASDSIAVDEAADTLLVGDVLVDLSDWSFSEIALDNANFATIRGAEWGVDSDAHVAAAAWRYGYAILLDTRTGEALATLQPGGNLATACIGGGRAYFPDLQTDSIIVYRLESGTVVDRLAGAPRVSACAVNRSRESLLLHSATDGALYAVPR